MKLGRASKLLLYGFVVLEAVIIAFFIFKTLANGK